MGDSGSLTIGFILGVLFVKFSMDNLIVLPFRRNSMLLAYTLLIVPVFDVFRVIVVRLFHRRPIFGADKNHIHHKFMRAGLSQHKALAAIIGMAVLFICINYVLINYISVTYVVLVDIVVWIAVHEIVDVFIRKNGMEVFHIQEETNE